MSSPKVENGASDPGYIALQAGSDGSENISGGRAFSSGSSFGGKSRIKSDRLFQSRKKTVVVNLSKTKGKAGSARKDRVNRRVVKKKSRHKGRSLQNTFTTHKEGAMGSSFSDATGLLAGINRIQSFEKTRFGHIAKQANAGPFSQIDDCGDIKGFQKQMRKKKVKKNHSDLVETSMFMVSSMKKICRAAIKAHKMKKKVLVVFDVDDTLLKPCQILGSERWIQENKRNGFKYFGGSSSHFFKVKSSVEKAMVMMPVEKDAVKMCMLFNRKGIEIIALTARSKKLKAVTEKVLKFHGFALSKIIMGAKEDKGAQLCAHIAEVAKFGKPDLVIFVDDKKSHVEDVFSALQRIEGISVLAFHYIRVDKDLEKKYRSKAKKIEFLEIGRIQFEQFKKSKTFISDEDAMQILETKK